MPKAFEPEVPTTTRNPHNVVSCKLPSDIIAPFYDLCAKTGLSPSRLCGQMIRYALENMKWNG